MAGCIIILRTLVVIRKEALGIIFKIKKMFEKKEKKTLQIINDCQRNHIIAHSAVRHFGRIDRYTI